MSKRTRQQNELMEGLRVVLRAARDHCQLAFENPSLYGLTDKQVNDFQEGQNNVSNLIQATYDE